MNRKLVLVLAVVGGLALAGAGSLGLAQEPEPAVAPSSSSESEQSGVPPKSLSPPEVPEMADSGAGVDSPQETWIRIAGTALRPREDDVSYNEGGGGGCIYATSGDPNTVWTAPVYLPQGATVRKMRMYYYDISGEQCHSWFTVFSSWGNVQYEWSASSDIVGTWYADTVLFSHTVDYSQYSYIVHWQPKDTGTDMQLCGFRIYYEPPPFGLSLLPLTPKNHSP